MDSHSGRGHTDRTGPHIHDYGYTHEYSDQHGDVHLDTHADRCANHYNNANANQNLHTHRDRDAYTDPYTHSELDLVRRRFRAVLQCTGGG